jgi:hypothetical protein
VRPQRTYNISKATFFPLRVVTSVLKLTVLKLTVLKLTVLKLTVLNLKQKKKGAAHASSKSDERIL